MNDLKKTKSFLGTHGTTPPSQMTDGECRFYLTNWSIDPVLNFTMYVNKMNQNDSSVLYVNLQFRKR